MEKYFKVFSNFFSNSKKEDENKLDQDIFLSNILYSYKMQRNRKINHYGNINKEKCPKCSSEILAEKYSHFHIPNKSSHNSIKSNKEIINNKDNIIDNLKNNNQNIISPIKIKIKEEKEYNNNISENWNEISEDFLKEELLKMNYKHEEKIFEFFYNHAIMKGNYTNFPFFDFINFKKFLICLRGDDDSNGNKEIKELVLNHNLSSLLINKFINLIKNRVIEAIDNNENILYPFIEFLIINDINDLNNFSKDTFVQYKNYNILILIIHYSNWNIIVLNKINNYAIFFLYEPYENIDEEIAYKIIMNISQIYDENINWKLKAFNYFSQDFYHEIYTLIAMDYYSRGILDIPIFNEVDLEYYSILISVELINGTLYTCIK